MMVANVPPAPGPGGVLSRVPAARGARREYTHGRHEATDR